MVGVSRLAILGTSYIRKWSALYFVRQSKHRKIHQEQDEARLITIKGRNKDMKKLLMLMLIKQFLLVNS